MIYNCQLCDKWLDDDYHTAKYIVIKGKEREICPDCFDEETIEE